MSEQPQTDSHQSINAQDTSVQKSNVGQVSGSGNLTQIQGEVVNVSVYDSAGLVEVIAKIIIERLSGTFRSANQKEYRYRKFLLDQVKEYWIEGVLEKSLHVKALIELGLEKRLDAVKRPFSDVQDPPDKSVEPLPTGTDITDVFQMGEGRTLLILGEPGAGKTITLLRLAMSLIACAEKDDSLPIPLVFNLSSWASKQQNIDDWLVEELNSEYGVTDKKVSKAWLRNEQLILLLDGLDEVKKESKEVCVQALNQFLQKHRLTQMVVCSRIKEYEALSADLKLQGAICIQSLTPEQISQYLQRAGNQLETLKAMLQEDTALQELAKIPLTLSIMTLTYQGISVEDLPKIGSVEERRKNLFNEYIEKMFKHRGAKQQYSKAKTKDWLIWLAQRMSQESETEFKIDGMQPHYLNNKLRQWQYWLLLFIINSVISGTIATIVILQWFQLNNSLSWSSISNRILLFSLFFGFILSTESKSDGTRLIMYPIVQAFCSLFRKKLPREFQEHIPILHDIAISSRFRLKIPSLIDLKNKVLKPSLGIALWMSELMWQIPLLSIIIPIHIVFGKLAYVIGFKSLGSNSKKYFQLLVKRARSLANEANESIDTNQNPNCIFLYAILDQYVQMIQIRGGWLLNLVLKSLTFILGLIIFIIDIITSLFYILVAENIEESLAPNYRLKEALKTALLISILFCLSSFLAFQMSATYYRGISGIFGFLACFSYLPLTKHLSLRLVLWQSGIIPWNYVRFLDYATDRIFLQKVGGGYIFIHRLLLEHFAQMEPEQGRR